MIDEWKLNKRDELDTGFDNLEETLGDEAPMAKVEFDKDLGHVIASDGSDYRNMKARKVMII